MARSTLATVLADAQRIGMLGDRPVPEIIEHARSFLAVLPPWVTRVIDLGSGAGVPGLVVAVERPDVSITLVDRRQKRTDFLERAVRSLSLEERCRVWWCDVADVVRRCEARTPGFEPWDAVLCRGLGPPDRTVTWARSLVTPDGVIVISEPPADRGDRWPAETLARLGVVRRITDHPGVVVLGRQQDRQSDQP